MKTLIIILGVIYSHSLFAFDTDIKKGIKKQVKEKLLDKITPKKTEEESTIVPSYYISYGYSARKAPVITINNSGEVVYDDPKFHRVSFLKSMEEWSFGLAVDYDQNTKDVSSIIGRFGGKDWYVVVESAKLSGRIDVSGGGEIPFKDNKYLDVKFLKYKNNKNNPDKSVGLGIQYMTYERASVLNKDLQSYLDPKAKVTYVGFVFEFDNVRRKLMSGEKMKKHDWFFYNTTSFGVGSIKLSDETRKDLTTLGKPKDDSYLGLG